MLRRRPDSTLEFRLVEAALFAAAPAPLTSERRDALRLRIMSNLGPQDPSRRRLPPMPGLVRERWVSIPAGVGIAAAIIAANQAVLHLSRPSSSPEPVVQATGEILVNGQAATHAVAGQRIEARTATWISLGDAQAGLEPGSVVRFSGAGESMILWIEAGDVTVVTGDRALSVSGGSWVASLQAGTVARFVPIGEATVVHVEAGVVQLASRGQTHTVTPANSPLFVPGLADKPAEDTPGDGLHAPPPAPIDASAGSSGDAAGASAGEGGQDFDLPPSDPPGQGGENPGNGPPSDPPGQGGENPGNGPPSDPPGQGGENPGNGPPSDPPGQGGENPGNGPPSDPPGQGGENPGNGPPSDPPGQGGENPGNGPPSDPPGRGGENPGNGPPSDPPGQGGENPGNGPPSDPPGQGGEKPGNGPPSDPPGQGGENPGNGPPSDPPGQGNGHGSGKE